MIIREFFMKTIIIPYLYGSIMPTPTLTHAKTILSITDELLATRLLTLGIFPGKKINLIKHFMHLGLKNGKQSLLMKKFKPLP